MKIPFILLIIFVSGRIMAQSNTESYPADPDSKPQAGVPKGEILKFTFANSKIFPGTSREISVYVPAQYKADKPACVYVNQDGIQWEAPTVFDNLIAKNKMPGICPAGLSEGFKHIFKCLLYLFLTSKFLSVKIRPG